MIQIQLTTEEKNSLRSIYDPKSDDGVVSEVAQSLIAKGVLYRTPPNGIDLTDLGEQLCEQLFGSQSPRFNFGE